MGPNQNSIFTPPSDLRGTRDGQAWEVSGSCQASFPECLSHSEKAWSGGPSPRACPTAPCPFQAPRLLSSVLLPATRRATCSQRARAHRCPGSQLPLPTHRPGHSPLLLSLQLCPQQDTAAARPTTVSLRCGHLLLGGFSFFISLDNAFFQD